MAVIHDAPSWEEIDPFIAAYEQSHARHGHANIADFLPAPSHPHYLSVLCELVRVDLEYAWQSGQPRRVEDYLASFPALRQDRDGLRAIAFEEYRQRRQRGEQPSPAEYRRRLGVDTFDWPAPDEPTDVPPCAPPPSPESSGLELAAAAYLERHTRHSANGEPALGQDEESMQLFEEVHRADPEAARRLAEAVTSFPAPGMDFLGFRLIRELGRGAFGRVYLARQGDLANRPVALKVAGDLLGESQRLAQLQHTNIVPIYSAHRGGPFHALCMPYFGRTTLADVLAELRALPVPPLSASWLTSLLRQRSDSAVSGTALAPLQNRSYADAVLWLGARLADGLAYAHQRGILHQDLKPANVLLGDDGQPMLLDFSLSQDMKVRGKATAAGIGGTLAYMAPEHLEAFRAGRFHADPRSDIYALGLILYELLAGRPAFPMPSGKLAEKLRALIADRRRGAPDIRRHNRSLTPAVASLLRHCLHPDPEQRYQSASQLREDLERHLADLPLRHAAEPSLRERARKWARRHPRLTSGYGVAAVAAVVLLASGALYTVRTRQLARIQAVEARRQTAEDLRLCRFLLGGPSPTAAEREEGTALAQAGLQRYRVLDNPLWEQQTPAADFPEEERERLRAEIGELLLLLGRAERLQALAGPAEDRDDRLTSALRLNEQAEACCRGGEGLRAVRLQRALLLDQLGRQEEARELAEAARTLPLTTPRDFYLAAVEAMGRGDYHEARQHLRQARQLDPQDAFIAYALGLCCAEQGEYGKAAAHLESSLSLWPSFHGSHYQRGRVHYELKEYPEAVDEFNKVLRLRPDYLPAYVDRALARAALGDLPGAEADLTEALRQGAPTRVFFMRAQVRHRAGNLDGAKEDRAEGLRRRPDDEASWVVRGVARLPRDPEGALADFEEALKLNPRSRAALENKAHVLAERLGRTEEAIQVLNRAVELYPDYLAARAGRGVLLARLGRRGPAVADAEEVLRRDAPPFTLYQVAGIYALTSRQQPDDRREALRLLAAALRGGAGLDLLDSDPDLAPLRETREFREVVEAARRLSTAGSHRRDGQR